MKQRFRENLKSLKRNVPFVVVASLLSATVAIGLVIGMVGLAA